MYEEEINTLLAKYGLDTVDAEGWYPIRPVLEFLTEVETHYDMFDLIGIGKHIGANFVIPDPYQDMVTYLMATDQFYAVPYQGVSPLNKLTAVTFASPCVPPGLMITGTAHSMA